MDVDQSPCGRKPLIATLPNEGAQSVRTSAVHVSPNARLRLLFCVGGLLDSDVGSKSAPRGRCAGSA